MSGTVPGQSRSISNHPSTPSESRERDRRYVKEVSNSEYQIDETNPIKDTSTQTSQRVLKKLAYLDPNDRSRATKIIKYHPAYHKIVKLAKTNFQKKQEPTTKPLQPTLTLSTQSSTEVDLMRMSPEERIRYIQSLTGGSGGSSSSSSTPSSSLSTTSATLGPGKAGKAGMIMQTAGTGKMSLRDKLEMDQRLKEERMKRQEEEEKRAQKDGSIIKRRPNYFISGLLLTAGTGSTTRLPVDFTADSLEFKSYILDTSKIDLHRPGTSGHGIAAGRQPAAEDGITLRSFSLTSALYNEPADTAHPLSAKSYDGKTKVVWRLYFYRDSNDSKPLEFTLVKKSCYRVGSDEQMCDIIIDDSSIQPLHGVIQFRKVLRPAPSPDLPSKHMIIPYYYDIGSKGGSYFGNNPLDRVKYNQFYEILPGDRLHFGSWTGELLFMKVEEPISDYAYTLRDDDDDDGDIVGMQ